LLVAIFEYRDRSFRVDEEISRVLALPVLAVVPMMIAEQERAKLRWRRLAFSASLGTITFACLAVVVYTLVR
jgi:hypothetical protein